MAPKKFDSKNNSNTKIYRKINDINNRFNLIVNLFIISKTPFKHKII